MTLKNRQVDHKNKEDSQFDLAAKIALFSLLNLTILPIVSFVYLLSMAYRHHRNPYLTTFEQQQLKVSLWINLIAGFALFGLSLIIFYLEAIQPAMRWALIITYFTLFHSFFILIAVWIWSRARVGLPCWGKAIKDMV